MTDCKTAIRATGSYVPECRESNKKLEMELGLPPAWIRERTGVLSRAIASPDDAVSDLAIRAGKRALTRFEENDNVPPIKALLLATSTPDHMLPPTAPSVAAKLGLSGIAAMDITVACSGFLYAMILADSMCRTGNGSVMIIAANILSRRCRQDDSATRPIFGDAAGAVVVSPSSESSGIRSTAWESDGSQWDKLLIPDGGSRNPLGSDSFESARHLMQLNDGPAIFKHAVQSMARMGNSVIRKAEITPNEIDWWIPHQASTRIIEACGRMLKIEDTRTLTTVEMFGNSSAATIPVTLDRFMAGGAHPIIGAGDTILMTAAAAGMTSAAVVIKM